MNTGFQPLRTLVPRPLFHVRIGYRDLALTYVEDGKLDADFSRSLFNRA
jgi:hypothetical protein